MFHDKKYKGKEQLTIEKGQLTIHGKSQKYKDKKYMIIG